MTEISHRSIHNGRSTISSFFYFLESVSHYITEATQKMSGFAHILSLVMGTILLLLAFNMWRAYVPKMLRTLIDHNCILSTKSDITTRYQDFLEDYSRALGGPVTYLIAGTLLICHILIRVIPRIQFHSGPSSLFSSRDIFTLLPESMIVTLLLYFIGITLSIIFISGKYLRKLLRDFQISSDPIHPDKCGGLKILGNCCLRLALPLLVGFIFFFVDDLVLLNLHSVSNWPLTLWTTLFVVFVLALPLTIWASVVPLWMIHTKMVHDSEIYQQKWSLERNAVQNQMRDLLKNDQLAQAKIVKEKRDLIETLYTSYPTWPLNFKADIFSTFLLSLGTALPATIIPLLLQYLTHQPTAYHISTQILYTFPQICYNSTT